MKISEKKIMLWAAVLAAMTIAIGAFGAHALERLVPEDAVASFETGVRYQMYHALALLVVGVASHISVATKKWVFFFFVFGILLFSGSIYILSLKTVLPFSPTFLGPVTPIGGLLFIVGWIRLAYGLLTNKR
ncbi:MAG: DUF423 domain-containing protein [Flavobacteriales bacterium]|nr:DUF423 domain-containing protein [Flavobacteriales bacterium]